MELESSDPGIVGIVRRVRRVDPTDRVSAIIASRAGHGRSILHLRHDGRDPGLLPGPGAHAQVRPFAPVWLFLVGYVQVYVIQALSYREWALAIRGSDLVTAANFRAFWAILWFLAVYHLGVGRRLAPALPRPPRGWSPGLVAAISPPLVLWGLFCAGIMIKGGSQGPDSMSAEESLFRSFPFVMMVAAILLIVTGRSISSPRPLFLPAGLLVALAYVAIWMFNGKRSHSLIGVLATVCAFYITRLQAALLAGPVRHLVRRGPGRGDRHRLAEQPELRDVDVRLHPVSRRFQAREDPREPQHRGRGG